MSKSLLSVDYVMATVILPATARKKSEEEIEHVKDAEWTKIQKACNSLGPRKKGKEKIVTGVSSAGTNIPQAVINSIDPSNQFVVLGSSEDKLEEGEIQHLEGFEVENEVSVTMDQVGPDFLSPKGVG